MRKKSRSRATLRELKSFWWPLKSSLTWRTYTAVFLNQQGPSVWSKIQLLGYFLIKKTNLKSDVPLLRRNHQFLVEQCFPKKYYKFFHLKSTSRQSKKNSVAH